MEYELYTVIDFANDTSFQSFIYKKDVEDIKFWLDWIKKHPHKQKETDEASYLLRSLYVETKKITDSEYNNELKRLQHTLQIKTQTKNVFHNKPKKTNAKLYYKIAASVSILFIVSLLYLKFGNPHIFQIPEASIDYVEKNTTKGQKIEVKLSDGSIITLNAESVLKYPKKFSSKERKVFLTGEAFFKVAHNAKKPFIINTGDMITTVLGTSFNISAYPEDDDISVAVATGKVAFEKKSSSKNSDGIILQPNEIGIFNKTAINLKKTQFDNDETFGWTKGILHFEDTPLSKVFVLIERWYGVDIKINNPSHLDLTKKYTGSFKNESLENVLKVIKYKVQYEYKIKQKTVLIN